MQNVSDRFEAPSGFKSEMEENLLKCKKRVEQSRNGRVVVSRQEPPAPSRSVIRRNERERNRVRMVNSGFATLRQHVPKGTKNKKMSKVDTLKSAVEYIKQLQTLLTQDGSSFRATVKSEPNFENGDEREYYENKDSMENLYSNDVAATGMDIRVRQSMGNNAYQTENSGDAQLPGYSLTSSPAPSWGSENNCSPYSNENSPEEDILTFATWFS